MAAAWLEDRSYVIFTSTGAGDRLLMSQRYSERRKNDVLKETIVHSSNEKSDRFLYLAASL